jgi:hypothetical protein
VVTNSVVEAARHLVQDFPPLLEMRNWLLVDGATDSVMAVQRTLVLVGLIRLMETDLEIFGGGARVTTCPAGGKTMFLMDALIATA